MRRPTLPALALLFAVLATSFLAPRSWSQDWGMVPNISSTMGVNAGRICYGESSRGDIGCPTDAPLISGSTITGTFIGDGSGLTGLVGASADRIISGTAQLIANGNSNSISITEAGVTTGYYYGGVWVAGGISTTGKISATNLYISNSIGIGTNTPVAKLNVIGGTSGSMVAIRGSGDSVYQPNAYFSVVGNSFGATKLAEIGATDGANSYMGGFRFSDIATGGDWMVPRLDMQQSYGGSPEIRTLLSTDNAAYAGMKFTVQSVANISLTASAAYGWYNYTTELMRLDAAGRLGIGTSTPSATLHVNGSTGLYVSNPAYTGSFGARITANNTITFDAPQIGGFMTAGPGNQVNIVGQSFQSTDRGALFSNLQPTTFSGNSLQTNIGNVKLATVSGLVGISLTSAADPSTTLHVNGSIRIGSETSSTLNTCDTNRTGAIRYTSATFQTCDGTGWASLLTTSSTIAATDRLTSGTSTAILNPNGDITVRGRLDIVTNSAVIAIGYQAGLLNTGGTVTIVGYATGRSNSGNAVTALGNYAAQSNIGNYSTFMGHVAGQNNTASNVTALGYYAAQNNTAGNLTALGLQAGISNTFSNATLLGSGVYTADKANQVVLGNNTVVEVSTAGIYTGKGLQASGVVTATALNLADNPAITCGPATYGTTKFINGRPYYCRP